MLAPAKLESQRNGRQSIVHEALQRNHYSLPQPPTSPPRVDAGPPQLSPPRSPMNAIHARIRRYNSDIDPRSDAYRSAVLLLAGLEWGQNIDVLARRTGIDRSFVARAARRLIDNGVWAGGRTVAEWTALDEASGPFWNDVAVAQGKLCRRTLEDGAIEWAPPGFWNKGYHFVDPAVEKAMTATYFDAGERSTEAVPLAAELAAVSDTAATTAAPVTPAADPARETPAAESVAPSAPTDAADGVDPPAEEPTAEHPGEPDADEKPAPPSLMEIFSDAVWLR
jgi:hypothetical protein